METEKRKGEKKSTDIGKEEVKISLFGDYVDFHVENARDASRR